MCGWNRRLSGLWERATVLSALLAAVLAPARSGPGAPPKGSAADAERAERFEMMRDLARSAMMTEAAQGDGRNPVAPRTDPLHRWNEPARDGTLWAWGGSGRPVALLSLGHDPHPSFGPAWSYEPVSLADGPVAAAGANGFARLTADYLGVEGDGLLTWETRKPGLEMRPLSDAPAPGETKADHLFVYGTNPEVVLVLEARRRGQSPTRWEYGFTRLTGARPAANLDRRVVWNPTPVVGVAPDNSFVSRVLVPKAAKP